MLLALATVVGLTVLAPPPPSTESDLPDWNTTQPEGPAPAPVETPPSSEDLAKQKKATSNFLKAGAICLSTGLVPLTLGSVLYGVARQNQLEGSDHEPGVWEGPILMTFGAVVVTTGAVLLGVGADRKRQARTAHLRLAPLLTWRAGGALLGVSGSF